MISQRPAETDDRAVPGHWESDLLMGRRMTAIGTLVERWSRYVMLFRLPDGNTAESVRTGLAETIGRSLIISGSHSLGIKAKRWPNTPSSLSTPESRFTSAIRSHRGSEVPTRTPTDCCARYFPRTTDMAALTQDQLDQAACSLKTRPRQTLDWMTPSQKLAEALQ